MIVYNVQCIIIGERSARFLNLHLSVRHTIMFYVTSNLTFSRNITQLSEQMEVHIHVQYESKKRFQ